MGREAFYNLIIKSQFLPVSLGCDFYMYFQASLPPSLFFKICFLIDFRERQKHQQEKNINQLSPARPL